MKFKVFLISILFVNIVFGLTFEERKSKLIKVLQADVPHHSSYSIHRRHHHHHHHSSGSYSASAESREIRKRLKAYGYGNPNPRNYNNYPGAYQPVIRVPYGYTYYTTSPPALFASVVECTNSNVQSSQLLKILSNGKRNQIIIYPYQPNTPYQQYDPYVYQQYEYRNHPIYIRHHGHYHKVYPEDYYY